jgi:hypothetical protein
MQKIRVGQETASGNPLRGEIVCGADHASCGAEMVAAARATGKEKAATRTQNIAVMMRVFLTGASAGVNQDAGTVPTDVIWRLAALMLTDTIEARGRTKRYVGTTARSAPRRRREQH